MRLVAYTALAAFAMSWPIVSAQAQIKMTYESKQAGTITLEFQADNTVTGVYPKYTGHLQGTLKGTDRIDGNWWQDSGYSDDVKCNTQMNGTSYWGKFTLIEDADQKGFHGMWGACDKEPSDPWTGKLQE